MNKKRKISFLILAFIVGGIVLFKDPILAFAADFTLGNLNSGTYSYDVESDLNVLKNGEEYSFRYFSYGGYSSTRVALVFQGQDGQTEQSVINMSSYETVGLVNSGYWYNYTAYDNYFTFTVPSDISESDYWRVTNKVFTSDYLVLYLERYDYVAPTFGLSCNPSEIAVGEESTCSLQAHTSTNIKTISFEIETPGYRLLNIQSGSNFKTITNSNGLYSIEQKDNATPITSATDIEIASLRIKSETTGVTDPQIKIKDLAYTDEANASNATTSDPVVVDVQPSTTNPSTGLGLLYSTIIMIVLVSITGFLSYFINRKKLDSKI